MSFHHLSGDSNIGTHSLLRLNQASKVCVSICTDLFVSFCPPQADGKDTKMKISYKFADESVTEVEVSAEIGAVIIDSRRKEESLGRKERRHCYSLDAVDYAGKEYGAPDFTEELYGGIAEKNERIHNAFSHLSDVQQRRLLMLAGGMSMHEIAKKEGVNYRAVFDSIQAARKKFLKFF